MIKVDQHKQLVADFLVGRRIYLKVPSDLAQNLKLISCHLNQNMLISLCFLYTLSDQY